MSQKTAKRERRRDKVAAAVDAKSNGIPPLPPGSKPAFKVPGELFQLVLNYLQTKPFQEVHQLIGGIMRCEKMKE